MGKLLAIKWNPKKNQSIWEKNARNFEENIEEKVIKQKKGNEITAKRNSTIKSRKLK